MDEAYLSIRWETVHKHVHAEWREVAAPCQAGLKRIGFVTAETGLGKLCVEDVAAMCADGGLGSRTFASMEAARKFVSEVPVSGP
jgi:hypothetical protein